MRLRLPKMFSAAQRTAQGKDIEVILTVKMVRRPYGREFSAFVIIAELWRREVARPRHLWAFFAFLWKNDSLLLCSNVVKFFWRALDAIVRYLPHEKNNISVPSQTVATAQISPKICQGQSPTFGSHYSTFHPNRFTFGRVIAKRVKAVLLAHRVFALFALNTFEANN